MSSVAPVLILGTGASIQGVVASLRNTDLDFFIVGNNRSDYMVDKVGKEVGLISTIPKIRVPCPI